VEKLCKEKVATNDDRMKSLVVAFVKGISGQSLGDINHCVVDIEDIW